MDAISSPSRAEFLALFSYLRASRELHEWIAGAQAFALLNTALDSGLLGALSQASTPQELAAATGMGTSLVEDLCNALAAHDVVVHDAGTYRLSPKYAQLSAADVAVPLETLIRQTGVMVRGIQNATAAGGPYTTLPGEDVLAMAEGAGISSLSSSPHVAQESTGRLMSEIGALWRAGAHHLEAGCGVGNALLGIAVTYPAVTAVGIEIDEATAAEATRRAGVLAIADRVEVRHMDACDLDDEEVFDTAQWSQFFFPEQSRLPALQAIHRALKPDGLFLVPFLGSASEVSSRRRTDTLRAAGRSLRSRNKAFVTQVNDLVGDTPGRRKREARSAELQALLYSRWGVPVRSAAELESELEAAGFAVLRKAPITVSPFYHTRGLLLARRLP